MMETATAIMENRVLGIIAEYNPLHSGHIYQMNECKAACGADYTVIVMSGDFTQRGEPALTDKWSRTKAALRAGADLVVELPFYYACNGAGYFASGAVKILDAMGVVTHLGFGSEAGNIEELKSVAEALAEETSEISDRMKDFLSVGYSYPKAVEAAFGFESNIGYEPNNILALEYIKALNSIHSKIEPITIKRRGAGYNDIKISEDMISAKAIRNNLLTNKEFTTADGDLAIPGLPDFSSDILKEEREFLVLEEDSRYFDLLRSAILSSESWELRKIFSVTEGMENKMKNEVRYAKSLNDFIDRLKSKRYTRTRIQRMCAHTVIGFKKNAVIPEYIRVLGFNKKGSKLIKKIKESDNLKMPVISNINREKAKGIEIDIKASDIYNLICGKDLYAFSDYVKMLEIFG